MHFIKKLFEPVDMTTGKPWEKILLFMIPMLIGNIAQQLYNTVDSVVVGKFVGDNGANLRSHGSPGGCVEVYQSGTGTLLESHGAIRWHQPKRYGFVV